MTATETNQSKPTPQTQQQQQGATSPPQGAGNGVASSKEDLAKKWKHGVNVEGTPIFESVRKQVEGKVIVGIRGNWYDVTTFVPHHPGGDILQEFAGMDCTTRFLAYHHMEHLNGRKPVGTYEWNEEKPNGDPLEATYIQLYTKFRKLGYFQTSQLWHLKKFLVLMSILSLSIGCGYYYSNIDPTNNWAFHLGWIFMGFFWQQSGFMAHDCMHNQIFHNRKVDQTFGWFYANICFGISGRWWRDEHNEHHMFTNTAVSGVASSDPQMAEGIWIHNKMLVQFFPKLKYYILPIQHLLYLPALFFVGFFGLRIDSYVCERRASEFVGIALHWTWLLSFLSIFPTWQDSLSFLYLASMCVGVLEMQLTLSHYDKDFDEKEPSKSMGWMRRQLAIEVDISCPEWLDWFHGGLQMHSIHHLFPRISRQHYRACRRQLIESLKQHDDKNVRLDERNFFVALKDTILALKRVNNFKEYDPSTKMRLEPQ